MLNVWRLTGIHVGKLSKLIKKLEISFWLVHHRPIHITMNDNPLLPPSSVKGMTVLNKEEFKKVVTVPCFYLPIKIIKEGLKPLKSYLLKLQNFRPLKAATLDFVEAIKTKGSDASEKDGKMALLDPRKVKDFMDIKENDRYSLEKLGFNENYMSYTELLLTYDNYKADEILRSVIPSEFESVSGYSLIGHIVHLNLRDCVKDYRQIIGNVLLDKISPARTVVNKVDIIDNTFRNFQMELLCGDNDMIAKVRENKCTFEFDFSKVYWNSRLCTEHERIVERLNKNDVLYDVFCGVGPFAIPAAKKGCLVLANDLNPNSVDWLKSNLKLNKIGTNLSVFNKDGYDFIRDNIKEHLLTLNKEDCRSINIVMNLPALAITFLPAFQYLFSPEEVDKLDLLPTPRVIVYCFVKGVCDVYDTALSLISNELGIHLMRQDEEVEDIFFVRDVAPNKKMMRITLNLTKKILLSRKRSIEHELKDILHNKVNTADEDLKALGEIVRQAPPPKPVQENPKLMNNSSNSEIIEKYQTMEKNSEDALKKLESWSCEK